MANKRIYYAVHAVAIKGDGGNYDFGVTNDYEVAHGVQSVGVSTNFNLEQVFQLGQLEIYENVENIPDVEITLNKVLDGYPLLYHMATQDTTAGPSLANRSTAECIFGMAIYQDTENSAIAGANSAPSILACSGMFVGSVSYSFPLEDNFNEDITLVGNHKIWKNQPSHGADMATLPPVTFDTTDTGLDTNDDSPVGTGGINRRQDILFSFVAASGTDVNGAVSDPDSTILPYDVDGITDSGTNEEDVNGDYGAHLSSISISVDLGRTEINELGRRLPYTRVVDFPTEVTCEIETTTSSGDLVSATEDGVYGTGTGACVEGENLINRTIRIATCEGTRIYLGTKNRLSAVNYSGGDAAGGNVSVSYTYSTFNDFVVLHSGEQNINSTASTWWTQRGAHLVG